MEQEWKHDWISWNKLIEDIKEFEKIIQKGTTKEIEKWTKRDLEQVIKWAEYFEQVVERGSLTKEGAMCDKLEKSLSDYYRQNRPTFFLYFISWNTLFAARHLCLRHFLSNPFLPPHLLLLSLQHYFALIESPTFDELSHFASRLSIDLIPRIHSTSLSLVLSSFPASSSASASPNLNLST